MASPYPWHYTLRWLYYYRHPSTKRHSDLAPMPRSQDFPHAPGRIARIFFFGDLMCMKRDEVPAIDPSIRALLSGADLVIGNCEAPVIFKEVRPYAQYV